jgi:pSer/pThr/pTyr-binding forkhead associated (FHA) protein
MAKLLLKFEQSVLKEITLTPGVTTIGRLPDNHVHIDNLAVSGHHARIVWDQDHYVIEDNASLNGTYVNNRRVSRAQLRDGDSITIGKHTVLFEDAWHEEAPAPMPTEAHMPALPQMESTVVIGARQAQELIAQARAAAAGAAPAGGAPVAGEPPAATPAPDVSSRYETAVAKDRVGVVSVLSGKTDSHHYVLSGKMSVIGKSGMASIKLKGWFAPQVAAVINKRDGKYFIAASEKKTAVKVNGEVIAGQKELTEGDMVEVAGVKLTFDYQA